MPKIWKLMTKIFLQAQTCLFKKTRGIARAIKFEEKNTITDLIKGYLSLPNIKFTAETKLAQRRWLPP